MTRDDARLAEMRHLTKCAHDRHRAQADAMGEDAREWGGEHIPVPRMNVPQIARYVVAGLLLTAVVMTLLALGYTE